MRDARPAASNEKGMTLVEVLISLGLLAVIAVSVMTMLSVALHLNKLAQERSIATALTSERIQQITSMAYRQAADFEEYKLPEETAVDATPKTFTADYGELPDYPQYKRVVALSYGTPVAGMLSIETTVSWEHVGQGERSHVMVAYVHPGLE